MLKKIFSFFLLSFLFFSPHIMASTSYTMPDILLDYINNQNPSTADGYTNIINDGTDTSNTFSILYYDENGIEQNLYFNVYNGDSLVTSFAERLTSASGDINSNFIGLNLLLPSSAFGGAIYNSSATIDNIIGDFIGNYTHSTSAYGYARGGAIYNSASTIDNIIGNFTGNYTQSDSYGASGGGIYNYESTISTIIGNFIGNYTSGSAGSGGAISNSGSSTTSSSIPQITGDFIGNYTSGISTAYGGAIYNSLATIDSIKGNFIGNYASASTGYSHGGAIYNTYNSIGTIIGDFIQNFASSDSSTAYGGAIYNAYSSAAIGTIIGDFIGNYASSGTGIANGGAIYNSQTISFLADNRTSYFTDNYTLNGITKNFNAIHNEGGEITFYMQGAGSFVMNDSITGNGGTRTININGESAETNIFYMNDSISGNTVNVSNATMQFGLYTHNDGTITTGWSSDTTATIKFNNSILYLDLIGYTFTSGTNSILSEATLTFDSSEAILRNADLGVYILGKTGDLTDIVSSASSLHKITNVSANQFEIVYNPTSTLVTNSQLGDFMAEISDGSDLSAQSDSSATRFIFQASQIDIDTKQQAAIIDGGAQLSAVGASSALTRSAISAKQGTINTRISQEVAYNVENYIASSEDMGGLITEKQLKEISLWLMPNYTYERISDMQSGSFSHGYTSHLFGVTLGADKTFTTDLTKFYTLGLAADGGMGFSNTNQDFEHIKNDFYYYGISTYGALANRNWIFSTNIGYEINNSEIHQLLENYNIEENLATELDTTAIYAKLKAEYQLEFEGYYYLAPLYKKIFKNSELEAIKKIEDLKNLENLENLSLQELEKELEKSLLQLEKTLKYQLAQMEKEPEKPREYKYIHLAVIPYLGLEFTSTNTGSYEIYSYDTNTSTGTTFNVESERQNVFTIPLGLQIKPELEELNGFKVSPQIKLGLAYSCGDLYEKSVTTAKDLSAIAYLETENIDAFRGDFSLSANIKTSRLDNINFDLAYDLEASKNRFSHNFLAKASYEF